MNKREFDNKRSIIIQIYSSYSNIKIPIIEYSDDGIGPHYMSYSKDWGSIF